MLRSLPSAVDDALDTPYEPNAVFNQFLGSASMTFFSLFLSFVSTSCLVVSCFLCFFFPFLHIFLQISTASCVEPFFFGTGEKRNRLELSVNENKCERVGRVTKAMRRSTRTTGRGWHTETHDQRAHYHHEGSDHLLFRVS